MSASSSPPPGFLLRGRLGRRLSTNSQPFWTVSVKLAKANASGFRSSCLEE